jgi:hypothetical protein
MKFRHLPDEAEQQEINTLIEYQLARRTHEHAKVRTAQLSSALAHAEDDRAIAANDRSLAKSKLQGVLEDT